MNFLYKKLCDYSKTPNVLGFPLVVAGVFCDGFSLHPIYLYQQAEVVELVNASTISEADGQVMQSQNWKKIPADVVVTIE